MKQEVLKSVNQIFLFTFIALILVNLSLKAYTTLSTDSLYFFTSNAMEIFICGCIAVTFVYWLLHKETISPKIIGIAVTICILVGLALLKAHRRDLMHFSYIKSELFSFIGMSMFFLFLLYFFKNLKYFINNNFYRTEKALIKAENQLIRQQFDPHFLFNMFNTLYSMSLQNHPLLSKTILKLGSIMRYVTDQGSLTKVPLSNEIKFIKAFVDLQITRFGDDARINMEVDSDDSKLFIVPLLLMVPVENAFKHGCYVNDADNYVDIKISVIKNILVLTTSNRRIVERPTNDNERQGKGLTLLRERLRLSYPRKHKLDIEEMEDHFILNLELELEYDH